MRGHCEEHFTKQIPEKIQKCGCSMERMLDYFQSSFLLVTYNEKIQ